MDPDRAEEIAALRARVAQLEAEVAFLRTHPVMAQGIRGETLVAGLIGGTLTSFAAPHDVVTGGQQKIEVKFSKLNRPSQHSELRRWNWSKPLGWKDKGKDFDYLLLIGEKDLRHQAQYPPTGPYVYFLIPRSGVQSILSKGTTIGSNVQMNTNLAQANSPAQNALKAFLIAQESVVSLLAPAAAVPAPA